ncbi:hypothetical protein ACFV3I_05560 [Microbacterium sp. NPDC059771]|uniref:hypothetical protein n=1 Tax=Microbacterium sp. NPDC059771 TaxID=3346941 RepID=UPI003662BFAF
MTASLHHHTELIQQILRSHGLTNPRVPASPPAYAPDNREIIVTADHGVDLLDLESARLGIEQILDAEIHLISDRSPRGRDAATSAVDL